MLEQVTSMLHSVEIHLFYASVVWLAGWLLTSMPRGSATAKYLIWIAASLNFVLPLSAIPERFVPSRISWFTPQSVMQGVRIGIPLPAPAIAVIVVVWSLGTALMLIRLCLGVRACRHETLGLRRGLHVGGVPVNVSANRRSPSVDGILSSQICLPDGIECLLSVQELDAVLLHELRHAKRHDNLIRLLYEVSLCVLWFHPFVWLTGSRLSLYRELSCDEAATRHTDGSDLVSALDKLASGDRALLLQSGASSFMSRRIERLTNVQPHRNYLAANTILSLAFCAALLFGALGPVAFAAAASACAASKNQNVTIAGNLQRTAP